MACSICSQGKEDLAYIQKEQIQLLRDDRQLKDALDALGKQEQLPSVSDTNDCISSTICKNDISARDCLLSTPGNQECGVCSEGSTLAGSSSYCEQFLVCKKCRKLIQDYTYHQISALEVKKNILKVMNKNITDSDLFPSCRKEIVDESCKSSISTKRPSVTKSEVLGSEEKIRKLNQKEVKSKRKHAYEISYPNIYVRNTKYNRFFTRFRNGKWSRYRKDKRYLKRIIKKKRIRKKKQVASEVRDAVTQQKQVTPESRDAMTHQVVESSAENREMDQIKVNDGKKSEGNNYANIIVVENTNTTNDEEYCPFCKETVENPHEFHNCPSSSKYLICHLCHQSFSSLDMVENHIKNSHNLSSDKYCSNEGCHFSCVSEGFLKWHHHLHKLDPKKPDDNENCEINYINSGVNFKDVFCNREDVIVQILEISDDECSTSDHQRNVNITLKDLDMDIVTQIETVEDQFEDKCLKAMESSKKVVSITDKFSFSENTNSEKDSGFFENKNDMLQMSISSDKQMHHPFDPVVCSLCSKLFTSLEDLDKHVQTCHSQIQKWKCKYCNNFFRSEETLMIHGKSCLDHVREHSQISEVKPVQINGNELITQISDRNLDVGNEDLCSGNTNAKSYDDHLETSSCTRLIKSSDTETDLYMKSVTMGFCDNGIKKRSSAQKSKIHSCQECGKGFRSYAHLMEHKVSHSDTKLYSCNVCHKKFKRKNALSKHTRTFHSGQSDLLICHCGKVFTSKDHLESHLHNTEFHQTFSCTFCNASYKTKISLENHLLHHLEDKTKQSWPFTCKICGVKLSSVLSLQTHENLKHGNESWKCEYCSQEFKIKNLLKQHIQRKHKIGEKEYQCHICNKVFYIQKDLKRHANSHNKTRLYKCQMCKATFRTLYGLQSHKRIHSGDRPYACHICSKTFLFPSHLKSHLVSLHSLEVSSEMISRNGTHKCPVCGRCFLYRTSLASHLDTHAGCNSTYSAVMDEDSEDFWESFKGNDKESRKDICVIEVSQNSMLSKGSGNIVDTDLISNCKKESVMTKAIQVNNLFNIGDISINSVNMTSKQSENSLPMALNEPSTSALQKRKPVKVECEPNDIMRLTNSDSGSFANSEVQQALENALNIIEVNTLVTSEDEGDSLVTKNSLDASGRSVKEHENMGNVFISTENSNCSLSEVGTSSHSVDDITKYICGNCSKVFTNTKLLEDHLLSCYVDDTSGDYVVVYEEDTGDN
ncbi:uncharacterized protein LOC143036522 [Oratosquilla oratoria]|uniref:uncharacterized protein LOC143036522 n=1 Tax=Oratosquilla oratoria TaxID=337810 RepID=UPI003F767FF9